MDAGKTPFKTDYYMDIGAFSQQPLDDSSQGKNERDLITDNDPSHNDYMADQSSRHHGDGEDSEKTLGFAQASTYRFHIGTDKDNTFDYDFSNNL